MLNKLLSVIDLYGLEYRFTEEGDERFHTLFGKVMSILSILSIIIVSVLFGNEIFVYKNPMVNTGERFISPNETLIELNEFPLIFYFANRDPIMPIEDAFNYFEAETVEMGTNSNGNFSTKEPVSKKFVKCDLNNWKYKYHEPVKSLVNQLGSFCIDLKDVIVKNDLDELDSITQFIRIKKCDKNSNINCKAYNEKYNKVDIIMYSLDHVVNPDDYQEPLSYKLVYYATLLDNRLQYNIDYILLNNKIETDVGKVFHEMHTNDYTSSEFRRAQAFKDEENPIFINIVTTSSKLSSKISRRYKKFQDLLANIGGIANSIIILGHVILANYNTFCYTNFIFSEILKVKEKYSINVSFFY